MNRNLVVVSSVVLFHMTALWALQAGLLRHPADVIIPVEILSGLVETPPLNMAVPPSPPQVRVKPVADKTPAPAPLAVRQPAAIFDAPMAPNTLGIVTTPAPQTLDGSSVSAAVTAPSAMAAVTPPTSPSPAKIELPSSDADYLHNPKPPYPPISNRLHEEGKVLLSVLVGTDGKVEKVDLKKSSGFDRLDRAALATVPGWRFVPGRRAGVPEAMWVIVPIPFYLSE
jgi:periplasmic protein TonB